MPDLSTKVDLQRLVDDGIEESLNLDYKASPALTRESGSVSELCKDVSAFANSAGGQIVYGIEEDKKTKKPSKIDGGLADEKITREWVEQILNSKIQPRIDGVRITRIDLSPGFAYVITIPQSRTGPHQAPDLKYYKRFEQQSVAMYDYEIKDVMRRGTTPDLHVDLAFALGKNHEIEFAQGQDKSKPFTLHAQIENRSPQPAYHAIIDIGIVTELIVYTTAGTFLSIGPANNDRGVPMNWYRWILNSPPCLPIFKEHKANLTGDAILLGLAHNSLGVQNLLDLTVRVSAPGFSSVEHWAILARGPRLTLYPPGSPYAASRS